MRIQRRQLLKLATLAPAASLALAACGGDDDSTDSSGTAKIAGQDIYYERLSAGRGTPVVFMHGGLGLDHEYFRPWVDALAETNEVLLYDHFGNGKSSRPADFSALTLQRLSEDCNALTTALGISRFVLAGHSYGGSVALDFALRFPQRLAGLALVCTAPDAASFVMRNPLGGTPEQQMALNGLFGPVASDSALQALWEVAMPLYYNRNVVPASVASSGLVKREVYSAGAYQRGNQLLATYDLTARLKEIQVPTLVEYGQGDIWRFADNEKLAKMIPNATLKTFANSGHFPFQEEPELFLQVLRDFVGKLPR